MTRLRSLLFVAVTLGLTLCQAEAVLASMYKVTPIQISLSTRTASALLTLSNEGPDTLRFQLSAFAWNQSRQGAVELSPTEDIVFYPPLLMLKPGEERKIRVGTKAAIGPNEKTYRIFFEELPPLEKADESPGGSQVKFLTRMGIPIFVEPTSPLVKGDVEWIRLERGRLAFEVSNSGSVHFSMQKVRVTGSDASARQTFEKELASWYVLAGGSREFELELSEAECGQTKRVRIEVETNHRTFEKSAELPTGACGP
ncbi:MAG: molecular chaperone [Deltaproteobacteria bacterium]|nr:molecular chaperone [Deltaproteobacteria bacterium]